MKTVHQWMLNLHQGVDNFSAAKWLRALMKFLFDMNKHTELLMILPLYLNLQNYDSTVSKELPRVSLLYFETRRGIPLLERLTNLGAI